MTTIILKDVFIFESFAMSICTYVCVVLISRVSELLNCEGEQRLKTKDYCWWAAAEKEPE